MIKFSLLGETILEWNDKDIEHYHARRMAMDSMLCRFKATYPAERIDSVRSLLEDKERQMFQLFPKQISRLYSLIVGRLKGIRDSMSSLPGVLPLLKGAK